MRNRDHTVFFDYSSSHAADQASLHRAPWVVTNAVEGHFSPHFFKQSISPNLIEDGGVLIDNGRIVAVDRFTELKKKYSTTAVTDHEESILTPALVNAHSHLELSYLAEFGSQKQFVSGLPSWIRTLLSKKTDRIYSDDQIIAAGRQALEQMFQSGIGLVGDVANNVQSKLIGEDSSVQVLFFLELLGMAAKEERLALTRLDAEQNAEILFTVHSPYSSSPHLIQKVKKQALQKQHVFSIHLAECKEELEFLRHATGDFKELLAERGWWDGSFSPIIIDGMGSIQYLDRLGVLDNLTLCVHAVHVTPFEVSLLAERQAKICLCPGSNRHLGVGKAPVSEFIAQAILPALGTDSLASNTDLNLWREMQILREDHPALYPETIFAMATMGGAEALGCAEIMGSLAPGRRAFFLAVHSPVRTGKDIFEFLTSVGKTVRLSWIDL